MVLQRQRPIPVWGWAQPGEHVQVSLDRQSAHTTANAQGAWRVTLQPQEAGGPHTLQVQGDNTLRIQDVLVGDVWLGGGQSNMEWSVGQSADAAREIAQSDFPGIRHVKVPKTVSFQPLTDIGQVDWRVSSPAHTGEFSAAGYFFARKLHQELRIPIGIVNASWGGSNVETWFSPAALASRPEFHAERMPADVATFKSRYQDRMMDVVRRWQRGGLDVAGASAAWKNAEFDDSSWATLQAPGYWEEQGLADFDGVVWYRRSFELTPQQAGGDATLELGTVDDCDETYVNGQRIGDNCVWDAQRRYTVPAGLLKPGINVVAVRVKDTGGGGGFYGEAGRMQLATASGKVPLAGVWKARVESVLDKEQPSPNDLPTLAFNAMVNPLTGMPIRGVIWYQGESNVTRAQQYVPSFALLISDWRAQWRQPRLPFYFVQLASFLPLEKNSLAGSDWAELRDAQRQTLKVPATGMVVATDVGDANSVHPTNKQAIGLRLALLALKHDYGRKQLVASGPSYRSMRVRGTQVELRFSDLGHGLSVVPANAPLRGFTVAGADQKFVPAQARIQGDKVIVSSPDVARPQAVRYGWVNNPQESNLFNRDGLPASPFRTDDWPWVTDGVKYSY